MFGRPRTTVRPYEDDNLGERKPSFVLRPSINVIGLRELHQNIEKDVRRTMLFSNSEGS